jgi:predicted dienelactone hydrolase
MRLSRAREVGRLGFWGIILLGSPLPGITAGDGSSYDPSSVPSASGIERQELTVEDEARSRSIPILVSLPEGGGAAPVVLFSHGLGGSRHGSSYLGEHWAARGYAAVFLQHPGSDESVWREAPRASRMDSMRRAASMENFLLRVGDVRAILDALERFNDEPGHPLQDRLDLDRVGMSGHSFGAVTTQAVSGQRAPGAGRPFTDPRIRAAVILSPSAPRRGDPSDAFGGVDLPWMLMTGTKDVALIGDADVASRLAVFPALPEGDKYELVLDNAEHSAFTDRNLPGDSEPRNPNHHRAILAMSTAFWDAYLRDSAEARDWLSSDAPIGLLEAEDRWRSK